MKENFFKIGILYSMGQLLVKGLAFLLIPLYSKYLGADIYGQLALVDIIYNFFGMFIIFSIYSGYIRFYSEDINNDGFATVFNFSLISILIQGIIIIGFGKYFSKFLLQMENSYLILVLIFIRGSLEQIVALMESIYSMKYYVKKIIVLKFLITLVTLITILYLVIVKKETIIGIYKGYILGNFLILFYLLYDNKRRIKFTFNSVFLKKCLRFSIGLLLGSVSYLILAMIDRFFLKEYQSFTEVGVYSMGYKFASLIEIFFIASFKKVFTPFKFQEYKNENFECKLNKFFDYYNIIGMVIFLLISINIKLILYLFTSEEFLKAYSITSLIVFSYLLYGQIEFYSLGINLKNKTYITSLILLSGGVINILFNILWIKKYGMYGAAFSTIISYIVMLIVYVFISNRLYYLKFNFTKMLKLFTSGIVIYLLYLMISIQNLNIFLEAVVGNIMILVYFYIIYNYFLDKKEVNNFILNRIKRK